ncbi:hypothetical protein ACHAW6_000904 [Cyclotella cf. meneghiniana]
MATMYGQQGGYGQQQYGGGGYQQQPQYPQQTVQQGYGSQTQYQVPQQQTQQPQQQPAVVAPVEDKMAPIYVDTQHDDMVHDAQLDFYGTKLATCSSDRTIKIYDISGNSYTPNATLTGHNGPIYQLSWAHPKYSSCLASASFDGSVLIHRESRPGEWILVKAFHGLHDSSVNGVEFAPHEYGLVCAAASSDGRVSLMSHEDDGDWTVEYLSDSPLGVNAVSWSPYGVAEGQGGEVKSLPMRLATGGSDNGVKIWSKTEGGWEQESLEAEVGHNDWVRDVAWAPNVVPGRSVIASCSEDKTVIIWKSEDEEDVDNGKWTSMVLHTFEDPVWRVSWSVTGNILAVSSGDSNVTLWKEGLDGSWTQVSQVEDVASSD